MKGLENIKRCRNCGAWTFQRVRMIEYVPICYTCKKIIKK
jgi:hypothetical protein